MKNKFLRILSILLICASLISTMTVFVSAEDSETEEEEGGLSVVYQRNFDEGWDHKNGATHGNSYPVQTPFTIECEQTVTGYNHYLYMSLVEKAAKTSYLQVSLGNYVMGADKVGVVVEFDIRAEDGITESSNLLYGRLAPTAKDHNFLYAKDGMFYFGAPSNNKPFGEATDEWTHFVLVFDYSRYDEGYTTVTITSGGVSYSMEAADLQTFNPYFSFLRFQAPVGNNNNNIGESISYDNFKIYTGTTQVTDIPADDYGALVNKDAAKTVDVSGGATTGEKSDIQCYEEGLAMKVGVQRALSAGNRINLFDGTYGGPVVVDGEIMLPLVPILDHMKLEYYVHDNNMSVNIATSTGETLITVGRNSALVNGTVVPLTVAPGFLYNKDETKGYLAIAMDDIETLFSGWYSMYDNMGFILIAEKDDLLNRENGGLELMIETMKEFVFDFPTADQVLEDLRVGSNNFDHPYLYGNEDDFTYLREIYHADFSANPDSDEAILQKLVRSKVLKGINNYVSYAGMDADLNYNHTFRPYQVEKTASGEGDYIKTIVYQYEYGDAAAGEVDKGGYVYVGPGNGDYKALSYNYPINSYATHNLDPNDTVDGDANGAFLDWIDNTCPKCELSHMGYDCLGQRGGEATTFARKVIDIAFAYQMTGDLDFARLGYDMLHVLGNWQHWAPSHALNVSEATGAYAIALDWLYDGIEILEERGETDYRGNPVDLAFLVDSLWEHGVSESYRPNILGQDTAYARLNNDSFNNGEIVLSHSSTTYDDKNNWGCVCSSNMLIGSYFLMGHDQQTTIQTEIVVPCNLTTTEVTNKTFSGNNPYGGTYQELAAENAAFLLKAIPTYSLGQYAPEGAYVEGPGYWGYGTNELMRFLASIYNTVGTDYGILDAWGFDKTFYFAASIETMVYANELTNTAYFQSFAFNDGGGGAMETHAFFLAGIILEDDGLIQLRHQQMAYGKLTTSDDYTDLFYFRPRSAEGTSLSLDYAATGVEIYTARDSWEPYSLFTGMIGGLTYTGHGHQDTGAWQYFNDGQKWFIDLGSESYNVFQDTDYVKWRFRYYRLSAEGHNVLILSSKQATVPYGHNRSTGINAPMVDLDGNGELMESNEYGSFVTYDMTDVYTADGGTDKYASYAYRGIMLTNDRSTVVIQDELQMTGMETLNWYAHVPNGVTIRLSEDGLTAYLTADPPTKLVEGQHYTQKTIRVTLIGDDPRLKFEVRDTYSDYDLSAEENPYPVLDFMSHLQNGGDAQHSREGIQKLVITADGFLSLKLAVVIEAIDDYDPENEPPVSYEYTPMSAWVPTAGNSSSVEGDVTEEETTAKRGSSDYSLLNIVNGAFQLDNLYETGTAFTSGVADFYYNLTFVQWTLDVRGRELIESHQMYKPYLEKYDTYAAMYVAYQTAMCAKLDAAYKIASELNK